jgi:gliding motility-associated lipoprotein GldH
MRDTVECRMADPTGRWYGKGTGFIFAGPLTVAARVLYRHGSRFPAAGDYRIRLEQAMRTERLERGAGCGGELGAGGVARLFRDR